MVPTGVHLEETGGLAVVLDHPEVSGYKLGLTVSLEVSRTLSRPGWQHTAGTSQPHQFDQAKGQI